MSGMRQVVCKLSAWVNQQILKNSFAISITVLEALHPVCPCLSLFHSCMLSVRLEGICLSVSLSVCSSINNALWKYCGNNIINNNNAWQAPRKAAQPICMCTQAAKRVPYVPSNFRSGSLSLSPSLTAWHFALASSGLGQHYVRGMSSMWLQLRLRRAPSSPGWPITYT